MTFVRIHEIGIVKKELYLLHMQYCYNVAHAVLLEHCRIARILTVAHAIFLQHCRMVAQHYNQFANFSECCSNVACWLGSFMLF